MKKKIIASGLATLAAAITIVIMLTPAPLSAKKLYSAGNFLANTTICECPVAQGECVCSLNVPDPPPQGDNPMNTEDGAGNQ